MRWLLPVLYWFRLRSRDGSGVGWETHRGPGEFLPPFFAPGPWCIILL
nr:MAG TPA: hypothetical protein [Caudoviricetes sp.]